MSKKNLQASKSLKRNYLILFILFIVLTFALIYNSCSSEGFKSVKRSKALNNNLGAGFSVNINNGSYATQNKNVTLTFETPKKNLRGEEVNYELKLSRNSDCSDGEWEDYKPTKIWNLDNDNRTNEEKKEKEYFIYTKFREKRSRNVSPVSKSGAEGESDCVHDSILYDTHPPRLTIKSDFSGETSGTTTSQTTARLTFTGEDFGEISFQCQITQNPTSSPEDTCDNSQESGGSSWQPCPSSPINYTAEDLGASTMASNDKKEILFSLKGTDAAGNCIISNYEWTIEKTISTTSTIPSINLECPEPPNSNVLPNNIKAELPESSVPQNNQFSLLCKNNSGEFNPCNCESQSPCPPITSSSSNRSIKKESFIKESIDVGYDKYSLSVKLKNTQSEDRSEDPKICEWSVDSKSPEVVDLKVSTSSGSGDYNRDGKFEFIVEDNSDESGGSGVEVTLNYNIVGVQGSDETKTCNTKSRDCTFSVTGITPGIGTPKKYNLSVTAKDLVGNESLPKEFEFYVVSGIKSHTKEHEIDESSGMVDVLFVLDDSNSMSDESTELGKSFSGIINSLNGLNWQIAVTSMEQSSDGIKNFGKLVQLIDNASDTFLTNQYILSSQTTTCTAPLYCNSDARKLANIFQRTITKKENATDNNFTFLGTKKYGIQSVNTLLLNYSSPAAITIPDYTTPNSNEIQAIKAFFRKNSTLVVIFITNEKNCGAGTLLSACHNNDQANINYHQNLVNKVREILEEDDKKFVSYPMIPHPNKGHNNIYPGEDQDDYLKLAETTQGRKGRSGSNSVIWVDVNPNAGRTSRSSSQGCSNLQSAGAAGAYTGDLCEISKDILTIEKHSIGLSCNNPILDTSHKITYSYRGASGQQLESPTKNESNLLKITGGTSSYQIEVTEPSATNRINRILLESNPAGTAIPSGTYEVKYFCPSEEGIVYATTESGAITGRNALQQTPPTPSPPPPPTPPPRTTTERVLRYNI